MSIDKIKDLQRYVGAGPDGVLGNETLTKLKAKVNAPSKAIVAQFMANVYHESGGFKITTEDLKNYTSKRITEVFGTKVHSAKVTSTEAITLVGNEYALAERVYGLGNPIKAKELGNVAVGDGFKYRGRGFLQITGKYSYQELQNSGLIKKGDNVVDNPDLVATKYYWISAINYFNKRKLWGLVSTISDADTERLRRRVNGGLNGISEVKEKVKYYYSLFK